jgi:hypothetical protein
MRWGPGTMHSEAAGSGRASSFKSRRAPVRHKDLKWPKRWKPLDCHNTQTSINQELISTAQGNERVQVYILLSIQHTLTPGPAQNESLHQQEVLPYTYRY